MSFFLLHQDLSEPEFYGDLKKIMGRTDFSDQFRKLDNTLHI